MPDPSTFCDYTVLLRSWLLSIAEVSSYVVDRIVDTVDERCVNPFIWYSRNGTNNSDTLVQCSGDVNPDLMLFDIEIIDHERKLAETRRIAECIRQGADNYVPGDDFGQAGVWVQLIEVTDVDDNYVAKVPMWFDGIAFTAINLEITPA